MAHLSQKVWWIVWFSFSSALLHIFVHSDHIFSVCILCEYFLNVMLDWISEGRTLFCKLAMKCFTNWGKGANWVHMRKMLLLLTILPKGNYVVKRISFQSDWNLISISISLGFATFNCNYLMLWMFTSASKNVCNVLDWSFLPGNLLLL